MSTAISKSAISARRVVDEVRQLLELVVEKAVAELQVELALDGGDGGEMAEDNQGHEARINEIRAGSKVRSSMNPQI